MDSGYGVDSNLVRACLVALGLLCGLLQGCGGGPSDPPPVVLRSISVSPSAPQLALGVTQQFTANGTFSDGTTRDVSSQATWSSSSSAVATVTSSGLAKAVGVGSAQIQASSNSVSGSTTLQVTSAALQSISVSPSAPQLALGLTQQFTANGTFSDGTTGDVSSQVTWTSSSPTVASIVSGGLAKAVGVGSTQIQAGSNSVSGSTTLQVTAAVLSQINVTPAQASLVMNSWEAPPTQQFMATGVFSDGTQQDLTSTAAWSASPSTVASVSAGLASTLTVGSTSIMASSGSISGSGSLTVTTGLEKLSHIIFLVQENRSFDNYFGVLGQYRASKIAGALPTDVDGAGNLNPQPALPNANSPAQFISPYHFRTVCHDNASAGWFPSHDDVNSGMQDFLINVSKNLPATNDPYGDRPIGFYNEQDLPYYYELATQFATSDSMFSPVLAPTDINRMYLFAATSFGYFEVPIPNPLPSPPPTIFDRLDQAKISWRNYYHNSSHIFLQAWPIYGTDSDKVVPIYTTNPDGSIADPIGRWKTDLQTESTLPQVIFIERGGCTVDSTGGCSDVGVTGTDEHPGANVQTGAADTANIINALMQSPAWDSSVFILVYDEGGGMYDHVVPVARVKPDDIPPTYPTGVNAKAQFDQSGFRVPNIIVSPWLRPHFVSHVARDYTSILKLIEDRFGLQPLTARDAAADDMREFFDFTSPQLLVPPILPAQPTSGLCSYIQETP